MNLTLQSELVIAYLAALGNKPGALEIADAMEKNLYGATNWSMVDSAVYKAKTPEQRLAWWASGAPLQLKFTETSSGWWGPQISGGVLDTALIDAIRSAYESVFGVVDQTQAAVLADLKKPAPPVPPAPKPSSGGSSVALIGGLVATAAVIGVIVMVANGKKRR